MWPFPRSEKREEAPPAPSQDVVLAAILNTQQAALPAGATAHLETAAGYYARALALAEVSPATAATALLTPRVLAAMGRALIVKGESLHVLDGDGSMVRLLQPAAYEVLGQSPEPERWRYRVDLPTPSATRTRVYGFEDVIHCQYAVRPNAPWKGVGPLDGAPTTAALASRVEGSLRKEFSLPQGLAVFSNNGEAFYNQLGAGDADSDRDAALQSWANLSKPNQTGVLMATGFRESGEPDAVAPDPFAMPNSPPVTERIGPQPPSTIADLRGDIGATILAACGIPPALVRPQSAGAAREAYRQWLHGSVAYIAAIVLEELRRKLDVAALQLGFDGLFAADISGRARAFRQLVDAGMDAGRAATIAGIAA